MHRRLESLLDGGIDKMETAPSAVASATAVGAAGILGLVFVQIDHTHTPRSSSDNRLARCDSEATGTPPISRPTTSAVDYRTSATDSFPTSTSELPQFEPRNSIGRRNTVFRFPMRKKSSDAPVCEEESTEERKEEISYKQAFFRRFSGIQHSPISSPRSSIGPDSPSFSNGSTAPFLDTTGSTIQLPPNKLVKRESSRQTSRGSPASHKEPGYSPPLRRPATSHQRSATLQHFRRGGIAIDQSNLLSPATPPLKYSPAQQLELVQLKPDQVHWKKHFVARALRQNWVRSPGDRSRIEGSLHNSDSTTKRVLPDRPDPLGPLPFLVTANMITPNQTDTAHGHMHDSGVMNWSKENSPGGSHPIVLTHKKSRKNLSRQFNAPTWGLRNGRRKRQSMENSEVDGNAPMEVTTSHDIPQHGNFTEQSVSQQQLILGRDKGDLRLASNTLSRPTRKHNNSTLLPSLAQISNFELDITQVGSSSYSLPVSPLLRNTAMHKSNIVDPMQYPVPNQSTEFGSSPPVYATTQSRSHSAPGVVTSDRASTLVGSDIGIRSLSSGEDEDTDFHSETMFDSFRTGTTGSLRIRKPLEAMFDSSPSSNASQNKMNLCDEKVRGSFHEDPNVSGEDFAITPIKNGQSHPDYTSVPTNPQRQTSSSHVHSLSMPTRTIANEDFGRLSLEDDDDDEDWAREAEEFGVKNSLSPPSSSVNSRHASPNLRAVMADLTNGNDPLHRSAARPYDPLFEWSETQAEKKQHNDFCGRPKTEHGLQGKEFAGVRRRTPSLLLRTHSSPVVLDDLMGHSKGVKTTEEWGDDFFEHPDDGPDSGIRMVIPPAIQATQANISAHVGLLRDVKLIVKELQRLRSIAREKNILHGPHASLWTEAEGIICLAAAEDNDQIASPSASPTTIEFDLSTVDEQFRDCGFDGQDLEHPTEAFVHKSAPNEVFPDTTTVRRRSVFLPGDDIFGHNLDVEANVRVAKPSQYLDGSQERSIDAKLSKPATFPRVVGKDAAAVARTIMETMHQYRSISDPLHADLTVKSAGKLPFDTTSLRDLVTHANHLVKILSEIIKSTECATPSPPYSPQRAESPAFTRVFTDPITSPPRRLPRTKSHTSTIGSSTDSSPTKLHGKRIHLMTVM